jgi:hypothetical protein
MISNVFVRLKYNMSLASWLRLQRCGRTYALPLVCLSSLPAGEMRRGRNI